MRCSRCGQGILRATHLADGPPCEQCDACHGKLLSLSSYLAWAQGREGMDRLTLPRMGAVDTLNTDPATRRAMCCPRCEGIMVRFHVLADRKHGLDFCFHCETVWLDSGDWAYLQAHGLHTQIRRIATDSYQRQLRAQAMSEAQRQRYQTMWGEAEFEQIEGFRSWLEQQPGREKILRYLTQKP